MGLLLPHYPTLKHSDWHLRYENNLTLTRSDNKQTPLYRKTSQDFLVYKFLV